MRALFIGIFCLTSACGRQSDGPKIDPTLQQGVNLYLQFAPNHGDWDKLTEVSLYDGDTSDIPGAEEIGACESFDEHTPKQLGHKVIPGSETRRVYVKLGQTEYLSQAVIAHELGHCLHNFDHVDDPDAIMQPVVGSQDEIYWKEHLSERLYEMFHGKGIHALRPHEQL